MDKHRTSQPHYLAISILEIVAGVWFSTVAAARLKRLSFAVAGALIGFVLGLFIAAVCTVAQRVENAWNAIPIYALPLAVATVCVCFKTVAAFFYGAATGIMVCVVVLVEVYARAGKALNGTVLYAVWASLIVMSAIGRAFPDTVFVLFCASVSAYCLSSATIQLVLSGYYSGCDTLLDWRGGCPNNIAEGLMAATFAVSFSVQLFCMQRERKRRARALVRDDLSDRSDEDDESMVSYRRHRRRR